MTKTSKTLALAALAVSGIAVAPASAQNPGFAFGDLVIGFQATGGTGSSSYLLANLGQSGLLRDATANVSLLNLGVQLTTAFGANWFERTDLYVGIAGILSNDEFNGFLVNGDPDITPYVGIPRQSLGVEGTAESFAPFLTAQQTQSAANGMYVAHNIFETDGTGAVSSIAKNFNLVDYDDQNPISAGIQGNAYDGVFSGGVQSVFGAGLFGNLGGVNAEAALDFYRIQRFNNVPGQFGFGQPTDIGTFEGTVVIDNGGQVSLIVVPVPEPTTLVLLSAGVAMAGLSRRRRASRA